MNTPLAVLFCDALFLFVSKSAPAFFSFYSFPPTFHLFIVWTVAAKARAIQCEYLTIYGLLKMVIFGQLSSLKMVERNVA